MPHPEAEFGRFLVGDAGGAGLAGQDQACDTGRVDAVVAVLADLCPHVGVGLDGIQHDALVAASRQFMTETHPVMAGGLHRHQHLSRSAGLAKNLFFQQVDAFTGVGEGSELGDHFAIGRQGSGGMFAFTDVDADHCPAFGEHGSSWFQAFHKGGPLVEVLVGAAADGRRPAVEGDTRLKQKRLIQNLVGDAGHPARGRSQPTHSWHSGDKLSKTRATFFRVRRSSRRGAWRPASDCNGSWLYGWGFQMCEGSGHCFLQLRREAVFQTLDGEQLVATVGLIASPGAIGEQIQFGQSATCIPEGVAVETRHGALDAIEPPAGESIPIGGQGEKQIQADVLGPQAFEKAFAAETVVDPGERVGYFTNPLWHEQGQGLFSGMAGPSWRETCVADDL